MPDLSAPITPQEAERVWKSQALPSARSVATALTHAGRPVQPICRASKRRSQQNLRRAPKTRSLNCLLPLPR
jgi:hypothetical protein